jgi:hypothetical protein
MCRLCLESSESLPHVREDNISHYHGIEQLKFSRPEVFRRLYDMVLKATLTQKPRSGSQYGYGYIPDWTSLVHKLGRFSFMRTVAFPLFTS